MITVGDTAPDFTLQDMHGHPITMRKLRGTRVVLYFYPKDDTPGCTLEGREFSALYPAFAKRGVVVFGISKDSLESHCAFAEKYGFSVPLLTDDGDVCERYGVWVEKLLFGKKVMGIARTTFLIDEDGRIRKVWAAVEPAGHAEKVLAEMDYQSHATNS